MWPFEKKKHKTIRVQFIDHSTGNIFAESNVPLDQLPKSFEAATTMHLAEVDWEVLEARPMAAAEFSESGKLILIMQRAGKIERVDPRKMLFSLPTITNDAPPPIAIGSSKLGREVVEIHEDDWRQIEWISASAIDLIAHEIDAIRRIYVEERQGIGFKNLHVRSEILTPLEAGMLPLEALRAALPKSSCLAGFSYQKVAGIAHDSFAFRLLSSIEIFGVARESSIRTLCFANTAVNNMPFPDVQNLAKFAASHELLLVDWCNALIVEPTEAEYAAYFAPVER